MTLIKRLISAYKIDVPGVTIMQKSPPKSLLFWMLLDRFTDFVSTGLKDCH